jgi:hypothetical protein
MQKRPYSLSLILFFVVALILGGALVSPPNAEPAAADGIVRSRSAYPFDETVERVRKDVASKGIMLFRS